MSPELQVVFYALAIILAVYGFLKEFRFTALGFASFVVPFLWAAIEASDF